jgi:hypothetical protein
LELVELIRALTGVGGLFADLNTKGLSTNITANIISDIRARNK